MKSIRTALLLAGVAGATILGSCNKQTPLDELVRTVQAQQNAQGEEVVSEEDYEMVFMELASHLEEGTIMEVTKVEEGYVFKLLTNQKV